MTIQRIQTNKRMSQIVIHGDTIYLAGQVALDKPGTSFAEQTRNILDRIDALIFNAPMVFVYVQFVRHLLP